MVLVKTKGINRASFKLASGIRRYYYYAWKGGPLFWTQDGRPVSEPAPDAFKAAYDKAIRDHKPDRLAPEDRTKIKGLIALYKGSRNFLDLGQATRADYARKLEEVGKAWGNTPVRLFQHKRMRPKVKEWHQSFANTPRTADLNLGALVRILNFAVDEVLIDHHVAGGIKALHSADRAHIIWDPQEFEALIDGIAEHTALMLQFFRYTGMRRGDGITIPVSADKGDWLEWRTGKSRGKKEIIIPVYAELRGILSAIQSYKERQDLTGCLTILCNSRGHPWTAESVKTSFQRARANKDLNKRFHDLRGTAATEFCRAGLTDEEIADILGWQSKDVRAIRRKYVDRRNIVSAQVERMKRNAK